MNRFTRITIPLDEQESLVLKELARRDYRHPREQARFLLRCILLGEDGLAVTKEKTAVRVGQTTGGLVEVNP